MGSSFAWGPVRGWKGLRCSDFFLEDSVIDTQGLQAGHDHAALLEPRDLSSTAFPTRERTAMHDGHTGSGLARAYVSFSFSFWGRLWFSFGASLVAQTIKNPPAVLETRVWSLGWEDPLEEGMATHSSILNWRILRDRGTWQATVHGVAKSWTQLND